MHTNLFTLHNRIFDLLPPKNIKHRKLPYFPAHKTHRDFFVRNFWKNDECIL